MQSCGEKVKDVTVCPNCGSTDIERDDVDTDYKTGQVHLEMWCNDCEESWTDVFTPFQRRVVIDGAERRVSLEQPKR
jgi:predicted RNA-binding Zn-ribbon protein involved in translation (DUF1610 family)